MKRDPTDQLALAATNTSHVGIAKLCSGLDQRIQHRLQIERRPADHLQHITRRSLIFQRFLKIARAGLQRAICLRAGDGDHRLLGEGLEQPDLAVGKTTYLGAAKRHGADRGTIAQQRPCDLRFVAEAPDSRHQSGLGVQVTHMDASRVQNCPAVD